MSSPLLSPYMQLAATCVITFRENVVPLAASGRIVARWVRVLLKGSLGFRVLKNTYTVSLFVFI
jgi:hypothetical protein